MGEDLKVLLNLNSVCAFQKAAELFIIKWISTHSELVTYLNVTGFQKTSIGLKVTLFRNHQVIVAFLNFIRELDDTNSKAKVPSLKEYMTNCITSCFKLGSLV